MKFNVKQIYFPERGKAVYEPVGEFDTATLEPNFVVTKTVRTAISCGTERANLVGDRVGNLEAGEGFPRYVGYSGVGKVVAVGPAVRHIRVGDLVTYVWGTHSTYLVHGEPDVVKLEEGVTPEEGAFAFISTFPMAAVRKVRLGVGEPAMVMGLGILGQFAVQILRAAGAAPVICADPVESRRNEGLANGADYALNPLEADFAQKVIELTGGGVAAAIEVTGVGAGLNETLDCMKKYGRVALLGCTRNSEFTVDYYRKVHIPGISLIGAHTNSRPMFESSAELFTHADDLRAVMRMARYGRLDYKRMLKETHLPAEAPAVFERLMNDRNFPVGVQFDWTKE